MDTASATSKMWDLPVRIGHWAMVILIAGLWITAETAQMQAHKVLGLTMLGVVVFRIYWGFVGSPTARFANFLKGPAAVLAYIKAAPQTPVIGHNPLGAWSVAALLLLLATQVGLGVFSVDVDGLASGPLSHFVSFSQGRSAARLHELTFNILLGFIALHIAAVIFYALARRQKLIGAMITGGSAPNSMNSARGLAGRAVVGIMLASSISVAVGSGLRF